MFYWSWRVVGDLIQQPARPYVSIGSLQEYICGLSNEPIPTSTSHKLRGRKSVTADWAHYVEPASGLVTIVVMTLFTRYRVWSATMPICVTKALRCRLPAYIFSILSACLEQRWTLHKWCMISLYMEVAYKCGVEISIGTIFDPPDPLNSDGGGMMGHYLTLKLQSKGSRWSKTVFERYLEVTHGLSIFND